MIGEKIAKLFHKAEEPTPAHGANRAQRRAMMLQNGKRIGGIQIDPDLLSTVELYVKTQRGKHVIVGVKRK